MSDILKKICDVKVQEVADAKKATSLAEVRRDLMWSRDNAARSARLIRAMVWRPDRAVPDDAARATPAHTVR